MLKIRIIKSYPKCFKCKNEVKNDDENNYIMVRNKKMYFHLHCIEFDFLKLFLENSKNETEEIKDNKCNIQYSCC